jgi:hypothetical protein
MKKAIFGLAAVGAVIALRPVLKRRVVQKMQEHCRQMAVKCQEMMGGSSTETGEARALPEHCKQLADQFREEEAVGTA